MDDGACDDFASHADVSITSRCVSGLGSEGQISHAQRSDCNGEVHGDLRPGRGCTPIIDYLRVIRDTGFDRTVSIELEYSPEPDKIVDWVKEAYEKTDEIMQELGCRG